MSRSVAVPVLALLALAAAPAAAEVRSRQVEFGAGARAASESGGRVLLSADVGFAVDAIGPHWAGSPGVRVSLRTSVDGRSWSRSWAVPAVGVVEDRREDGTPNRYAGDTVGALVFVPRGTRFVDVEVEGGTLSTLTLHAIDAGEGAVRAKDDEPAPVPPPPPLRVPKPPIVRRAEWGARTPRQPFQLTLAQHMAVHHTASIGDFDVQEPEDCARRVRAIQAFHMDTNGWNDVGYNYLVCRHGQVFQGREDEDDATDVHAAHDGWNRGSMGTALLGYFHEPYLQVPTEEMLVALVTLLAWKADERGIDPLVAGLYAPFGAVVDRVYGHREVRPTACPGDVLFERKPWVRAAVAEVIRLAHLPPAEVPPPPSSAP